MTAPDPGLTVHRQNGAGHLILRGDWANETGQRMAELGEILLGCRVSVITIDLTDMRPYASPSCLRALLVLRAQLLRAGIQVHIQRRSPASGPRVRHFPTDRSRDDVVSGPVS